MRPFLFLFGYKYMRVKKRDLERFIELCGKAGLVYRDMKLGEAYCEFICTYFTARGIIALSVSHGIEVETVREAGIPALFSRYKKRYGFIIGAVASVFIIFLSSSVIWDIRIDGERRLSEKEVIEILRENGLHVGSSKRGLDTDKIENRTLIFSDDISWISVNITGTVAEVEIRETEPFPEEDESGTWDAGNLIASRGGKILYFEDVRGNIVTEVGEMVSEGQLLVGGVYGSETAGDRYTVARGRVIAETEREFRVEIPLYYEEKMFTGRKWSEKYLIFFEKEVKFFSNCGNSYKSCDTIYKEEEYTPLDPFELGELPTGIKTVRYMEYTAVRLERDEETAAGMAKSRLGEMIREELLDGEVMSMSYEGHIEGESYVLICRARCRENIAQEAEIELSFIK